MKLPSSAIALTLVFSPILVTVTVQPATAEHRTTEGKQSFDNKPEIRRWLQECRQQVCEKQIPFPSPESLEEQMSGNELNEPLHLIGKFQTTFEPPSKGEVFNQLRHTAFTSYSLLKAVRNSQYFLPHRIRLH